MKLMSWSSIIFNRKGFPRGKENNLSLTKKSIEKAIISTATFYFTKKDGRIKNKIKNYLFKEKLSKENINEDNKKIVLDKRPILDKLEMPEKVQILQLIKKEKIYILAIKKNEKIESFENEIFSGVLNLKLISPHLSTIKVGCHSCTEPLTKYENSTLKNHPISKHSFQHLLNQIKKRDLPLRVCKLIEKQTTGWIETKTN